MWRARMRALHFTSTMNWGGAVAACLFKVLALVVKVMKADGSCLTCTLCIAI
jgi:hypothetical protein